MLMGNGWNGGIRYRNLSNLDEGRAGGWGGHQVWMNDRLDDIPIP